MPPIIRSGGIKNIHDVVYHKWNEMMGIYGEDVFPNTSFTYVNGKRTLMNVQVLLNSCIYHA